MAPGRLRILVWFRRLFNRSFRHSLRLGRFRLRFSVQSRFRFRYKVSGHTRISLRFRLSAWFRRLFNRSFRHSRRLGRVRLRFPVQFRFLFRYRVSGQDRIFAQAQAFDRLEFSAWVQFTVPRESFAGRGASGSRRPCVSVCRFFIRHKNHDVPMVLKIYISRLIASAAHKHKCFKF